VGVDAGVVADLQRGRVNEAHPPAPPDKTVGQRTLGVLQP
jgi:hypothetical protein